MQPATHYYTREEYLDLEAHTEEKHEYFNGEIFTMAGGTLNHSLISTNITAILKTQLRGKSCQVTNSDMRISSPSGLNTYPDATVFCGKPDLADNQRTLLNPMIIIEILSPTTRRYDQSDKFLLYRAIPSFREYLLIDSEKIHIQHFRKENNEWILHEYFNLTDEVFLSSVMEKLALQHIYENIIFS